MGLKLQPQPQPPEEIMFIFYPEKCSINDNICVVALFETRRGNISALVEKMSPGTIVPRCDTLYKQSARIIYSHRLTASLQCSVSGEVAAEAAAWPGRLRLPRRMWVTELLSSPSPHWDTFRCCMVDIYISTLSTLSSAAINTGAELRVW